MTPLVVHEVGAGAELLQRRRGLGATAEAAHIAMLEREPTGVIGEVQGRPDQTTRAMVVFDPDETTPVRSGVLLAISVAEEVNGGWVSSRVRPTTLRARRERAGNSQFAMTT